MKEEKNIPSETAKPDFTPQELNDEAIGTAFTPVNGDPAGDEQAPEAEGGTSFDSSPQEEQLKSPVEPAADEVIDTGGLPDESSQLEAPHEKVSEGTVTGQEPVSEDLDDSVRESPKVEDSQSQEAGTEVTPEIPEASDPSHKDAEPSPTNHLEEAKPDIKENNNEVKAAPIDSESKETIETPSPEEQIDEAQETPDNEESEKPEEKKPDQKIDPLAKYEHGDYQNY
ncbi:MAG: hypothetical protein ACR2MX_09635, partial [Cyclobacteriaceae bacterium]